ncbi:hypothetical protein CAB17_02935 [Legionella sainthelensi]|uniref:Uncharacterized protein n=1 Tax=Legionella sainthelensi TaxID=28087 RepID=A0A2H5FHX8_9GAMM|nr:hypothetical protein CAB17_02935 [Legionella sainthelensi]
MFFFLFVFFHKGYQFKFINNENIIHILNYMQNLVKWHYILIALVLFKPNWYKCSKLNCKRKKIARHGVKLINSVEG